MPGVGEGVDLLLLATPRCGGRGLKLQCWVRGGDFRVFCLYDSLLCDNGYNGYKGKSTGHWLERRRAFVGGDRELGRLIVTVTKPLI